MIQELLYTNVYKCQILFQKVYQLGAIVRYLQDSDVSGMNISFFIIFVLKFLLCYKNSLNLAVASWMRRWNDTQGIFIVTAGDESMQPINANIFAIFHYFNLCSTDFGCYYRNILH